MKLLIIIVALCCTNGGSGYTEQGVSKRDISNEQSMIVGGDRTYITLHPSLAFVFVIHKGGSIPCVGTVLTVWNILTAGKCLLNNPILIIVIVGTTDIASNKGKGYKTTKYRIHENYRGTGSDFNIGVVKMGTAITLDDTTKLAKLATIQDKPKTGQLVTIVGWGRLSVNPVNTTNVLRAVKIPVIDILECRIRYKNILNILSNSFCAGLVQGGAGPCYGDAGSPAINSDDIQVGISSGFNECVRKGYPSVYTDVSSLRGWIRTVAGV